MTGETGSRRTPLVAALLAILVAAGGHLALGRHDLNLRDEGYLWYGVVAALAGDVPLRDFQAYDPGRYYWCAAWSPLFGSGIVGVRASLAVFQGIGLFLGLLVARRLMTRDAWLVPVALVLGLWMFPRHKLFEPAIVLAGVWSLTRLVEVPSVRRHVAAGVVCGLAAFLGRNHGLYLALGFLVLFALLHARRGGEVDRRAFGGWCLGVVAGYAPQLAMLLLVPGFAQGFLDAVLSVMRHGANVPVPYPWPWSVEAPLAIHVAYLLPVVLLPLGLVIALRTGGPELASRAPLVVAAVLGTIYAHHYTVRADLPHLAQAISPVLLIALALVARRAVVPRATTVTLLLALSVLVAREGNATLKAFLPGGPSVRWEDVEVAGETLRLKRDHGGEDVRQVQAVVAAKLGPDEPLFIGPTMPTLYPVLGKRSPTWWIYLLWPLTDDEQRGLVERLRERRVNWALIVRRPFAKDESFLLADTNPILWKHFLSDWAPEPGQDLPARYFLMRRR